MATNYTNRVVRHVRGSVPPQDGAGSTDGQLLSCFLERRDEDAFAALVTRHAPMVWGVCRRLLDRHDAEDAFQATFLVLVRKAAAVVPRELVGHWLYGVARQTALQARRTAARRRAKEGQLADPSDDGAGPPDPWHDLIPLLDQEVGRLPERYRTVIVLCDLGGKTRKEAARQLGVPEGTVAGRLARARALLAKRLPHPGGLRPGGVLAAVLAQTASSAGVPGSVVSSTLRVAALVATGQAAGAIASPVAALLEGVLKAMLLNKIKNTALALLVAAVAGTATGGVVFSSQAAEPPAPGTAAAPQSPPTPPPLQAPPPPAPFSVEPPAPPTEEQLRLRYVKLHEELSQRMTGSQVKQRIDELEREVAAVKERERQAAREKKAADELEKVRSALTEIASKYGETEAGRRASQALRLTQHPHGYFMIAPTPPSPPPSIPTVGPSSGKTDLAPPFPSIPGSDNSKK
jgi:RNA polymerase sigma factor (sigma-70 family)